MQSRTTRLIRAFRGRTLAGLNMAGPVQKAILVGAGGLGDAGNITRGLRRIGGGGKN